MRKIFLLLAFLFVKICCVSAYTSFETSLRTIDIPECCYTVHVVVYDIGSGGSKQFISEGDVKIGRCCSMKEPVYTNSSSSTNDLRMYLIKKS